MVHVVWDWNGTLFDDVEAVVAATSEIFAPYGLGPFGLDEFRAFYTRPIWVAYERVLGRALQDGEWERLDGLSDAFHRVEGLVLPEQAGGHKAGLLARHLAELGIDPADVIIIGDSADDAVAARQAGARAVMYTGGMTGRANLERIGVPVVNRLADAVGHI